MPSVSKNTTIKQYQDFVNDVYGISNERHFSLWDMHANMERFAMRALKGIRKNELEKTKLNLLISLSWFISTLNRLHIDLENEIWKKFPYICSYCGACPCDCKEKKIKTKQPLNIDELKKPNTLEDFQKMFERIYPPSSRSMDHAGVHLAEEIGEFSEAMLAYRGGFKEELFNEILTESADLFSCVAGVFNSLDVNIAKELSEMFGNSCHACKKAPCECSFDYIIKFKF